MKTTKNDNQSTTLWCERVCNIDLGRNADRKSRDKPYDDPSIDCFYTEIVTKRSGEYVSKNYENSQWNVHLCGIFGHTHGNRYKNVQSCDNKTVILFDLKMILGIECLSTHI